MKRKLQLYPFLLKFIFLIVFLYGYWNNSKALIPLLEKDVSKQLFLSAEILDIIDCYKIGKYRRSFPNPTLLVCNAISRNLL